jgi:hypothetical protein
MDARLWDMTRSSGATIGDVTSSAFALPVPAAASRRNDGPSRFAEFMLVGGATLVLFPLAWILRKALGSSSSDYAVGFLTFYGAYVINDPHFAVTYVLFYRDARKRAFDPGYGRSYRVRYVIAGLVVPVALAAWAIAALTARSAEMLGGMVQLMYLLVGWHYVKQGFGVMAVLSARRGSPVGVRERKVILAHAFAGWAYAWASPAVAAGQFEEKGVVYTALAHPRWLELATGVSLLVSSAALVVVLVSKWRRERRAFPLAPLAAFLITVWSWTIYSSVDRFVQYVIPALHSIQYLYFVWLMKRNEARAGEGPPTFGRPVAVRLGLLVLSALGIGWLALHGAPDVLDAAFVARPRRGVPLDALGPTPFLAAFFVFVNVHHYFMDHVIWRRDEPLTRYLREQAPRPH